MSPEHSHRDDHGHHHGHDHGHGHERGAVARAAEAQARGETSGHGHAHAGHSHAPADFGRAFLIGIVLNTAFVVVEGVYGALSHSLSLVADAGHNLGDVAGLALAWAAAWLGRRPPTPGRTYGLRRSSVLAALANAILLLVAIGAIAWEAVLRLLHPEPVAPLTVIVVAAIGIAVNGVTAWLFMAGRHGDLNIRGAYLHMAADAAVSLGVVVAGVLMLGTGALWIDPLVSLLVCGVILVGTWGLLRDALRLALDAVPPGIDAGAVRTWLAGLPGVTAVHDLHIWGMSTTETALTVHLVMPAAGPHDALLASIGQELAAHFHIGHATVQIESGDAAHPCRLEGEAVV